MLITRGNAARELLRDLIINKNSESEKKVVYKYFRGSCFEHDRESEYYPYQMLSNFMLSMRKIKTTFFLYFCLIFLKLLESGDLVVLESLDAVYESLFDVLNQKYQILSGQKYSRVKKKILFNKINIFFLKQIALGSYSNPLCLVFLFIFHQKILI